jgi:DNA-binding SARP family transcriptional activator
MGRFSLHRRERVATLRPSVRRLVALLAVNGEVDRIDAAAALFADLSSARAQGNLRTILWRLQEDCADLVADDGGFLRLVSAEVDYAAVNDWSLAVIHRTADGPAMPMSAGRDLLPTWGEAWLVEPREPLHLLQVHALEASAERFLLAGRFGEASDCALRAATLDPLRESAVKLLIEVLIREGNIADALNRYNRFAHRLHREVNAEPSMALRALVAPLLAAGYTYPRQFASSR